MTPTKYNAAKLSTSAALSERLEPRRLLTATFDDATGVLTILSGDEDAIIRFEDVTANEPDAESMFRVIQAAGRSTVPSDPSDDAAVLAYLDAAGSTEVFGPYNASDIFRVDIGTGTGDDLIIVGNRARVNVSVFGNTGNDTISGGRGSDTLFGNDGDDYLYGSSSDDLLTGGDGDDILLGGDGDYDFVDYGDLNGSAGVSVSLDNVANDGEGGDNVGIDVEAVSGTAGADTFDASVRPNVLVDRTSGFVRALPPVSFYGADGADILIGTDLDQVSLDNEAAVLGVVAPTFDGRADTLNGGLGADLLTGLAGRDIIIDANGDSDTVDGGRGGAIFVGDNSDTSTSATRLTPAEERPGTALTSGGGITFDDDGVITIDGSDGDDTVLVQIGRRDEGPQNLRFDFVRISSALDGGSPVIREFGITDLSDDDVERDTPAPTAVVFNGNDGDDVAYIASPSGEQIGDGVANLFARLLGGEGDDLLIGGDAADFIDGGTGNNILLGFDGNDTLLAGFGRDDFSGGQGQDRVDYSIRSPVEPLRVGLGSLFDDGFVGENDNVRGDVEELLGGDGNDELSTTANTAVRFFGQGGNDTLLGSNAGDFLAGGGGSDTLAGGNGADFFAALDGNVDQIFGGNGNDDGDFDSNDIVDLGVDG